MSSQHASVSTGAPEVGADLDPAREAAAAVHVGLWVSATRCVLTYVVAPVAGAFGLLLGPIGLLLMVCGTITATAGARRLWVLGHGLRIPYAVVAVAVDSLAILTLGETCAPLVGSVLG
jgi:hypothetical protein